MSDIPKFDVQPGQTIVVWFSCGAASAVALQKTIEKYGDICKILPVNNPVMEELEDNRRFMKSVEEWLQVEIEVAINEDFPNASAVEIWDKKKYMSGTKGAPCTVALKKQARYQWENRNHHDWLVLGFTAEERQRYDDFVKSERPNLLPVLIEDGITKDDCYKIITDAGLTLPESYLLGYENANCVGCVKATSPTYWNHVRRVHPIIFQQRAEQSRRIGARLVRVKGKRLFLDELPPDAKGHSMRSISFDCGIFCEEKTPT